MRFVQLCFKLLLIDARRLLGHLQLGNRFAFGFEFTLSRNALFIHCAQLVRERIECHTRRAQSRFAFHAHRQSRLQTLMMIDLLKLLQSNRLLFQTVLQHLQLLLRGLLVVLNVRQTLGQGLHAVLRIAILVFEFAQTRTFVRQLAFKSFKRILRSLPRVLARDQNRIAFIKQSLRFEFLRLQFFFCHSDFSDLIVNLRVASGALIALQIQFLHLHF